MIDIIIADDHVMVRRGIRGLLARQKDFNVLAEAGNYKEAVEQIDAHPVDLLVVDITMPGRDGFDIISHMRLAHPRTRILVLTMHTETEYVSRALKAGAHGYVTKDMTPEELTAAVREVAGGSAYLSPKVAQTLALELSQQVGQTPLHSRLSTREFAIYGMLAHGKTVTDIAHELDLSIKTVSAHKTSLLRKLNLRNQAELVRYAIEHPISAPS